SEGSASLSGPVPSGSPPPPPALGAGRSAAGVVAHRLPVSAHVAVLAPGDDHDRGVLADVSHAPVGGRVHPGHPAGADEVRGAVPEPELDLALMHEVGLLLLLVEV